MLRMKDEVYCPDLILFQQGLRAHLNKPHKPPDTPTLKSFNIVDTFQHNLWLPQTTIFQDFFQDLFSFEKSHQAN